MKTAGKENVQYFANASAQARSASQKKASNGSIPNNKQMSNSQSTITQNVSNWLQKRQFDILNTAASSSAQFTVATQQNSANSKSFNRLFSRMQSTNPSSLQSKKNLVSGATASGTKNISDFTHHI